MNRKTKIFALLKEESESVSAIQKRIREAEEKDRQRIIGFSLMENESVPPLRLNCVAYVTDVKADELPPISVVSAPSGKEDEFVVKHQLSNAIIAYSDALVDGAIKTIVISRPGRSLIMRGRMSHFGGPEDSGIREDEGLAIVNANNFPHYRELFIDGQMGGEIPLARQLDPETFYIACRWDREITPYDRLKDCTITVANPLTGKVMLATAVDYGPSPGTGRIADLSPGLERNLALKTDDECVVSITLPVDLATIVKPSKPPVIGGEGGISALREREVAKLFGTLRFSNGDYADIGGGRIKIENPSVIKDISPVFVKQLMGIRGAPAGGHVDFNIKVSDSLLRAFEEVEAMGLLDRIITFDGGFVARHINWDVSRGISLHSWGIAFDLNAHWNGYGARPADLGSKGSLLELVPIFENHGFFWGGRFRKPDGMHFQWGRTSIPS